jgi:lysylphosphatidylglycerol synthetase-like protein (DUF2156 family)
MDGEPKVTISAPPEGVRSRLSAAAKAMSKRELETMLPDGVDEPASTRLRVVTGYFQAAALLSALRLVMVGIFAIIGNDRFTDLFVAFPLQMIVAPTLSTIGLFWTARELRNRSRRAWWPAMLTIVSPLLFSITGRPMSTFGIVAAVAGLLTLISVRKELD